MVAAVAVKENIGRTASYTHRKKTKPAKASDLPWVSAPEPEPEPEPEQRETQASGIDPSQRVSSRLVGVAVGESAAWERERAAFEAERAEMVSKNDEFCIKNDEFCIEKRNCVF